MIKDDVPREQPGKECEEEGVTDNLFIPGEGECPEDTQGLARHTALRNWFGQKMADEVLGRLMLGLQYCISFLY